MDDNTNNNNKPETPVSPIDISPEGPERPIKEPVRFTAYDWLALVLGIALGALWFECFSLERLLYVPGAGTTAFVLGSLLCAAVYLRFKIDTRPQSIFLLASTLLLAVSCGLFGDYAVRMINLALLAFLTPASALAMAGRDFPALTPRLIPETFRLFIPNLFANFAKPFRALGGRGRSYTPVFVVLATLLLALPLFAVVISLLASADAVFSGMMGKMIDTIEDLFTHSDGAVKILKALVAGLMFFSFLYSLPRPAKPQSTQGIESSSLPCLPFISALTVLNVIYAVFAVIQFIYLFGGAETAAMHGGFAQYARAGFSQLVAVAGINLVACLVSLKAAGKGERALKVLIYTLIALTFVILASALYRMLLYISVYKLSVLRAMTLFAMSYIAVCLAALGVKTAKPEFKVFPVFVSVFLVFWLIFNYVNLDARIADYNVDAYLEGQTEEFDVDYLTHLSLSARPALRRLYESESGPEFEYLGDILEADPPQDYGNEARSNSWANWYFFD